jgi:hypothetical protein
VGRAERIAWLVMTAVVMVLALVILLAPQPGDRLVVPDAAVWR